VGVEFSPDKKLVGITDKDGKEKIVDLENGSVIFYGDKFSRTYLISNGKKVLIIYNGTGKRKIIAEDGTMIFEDDNIKWGRLSSNGKRAGIIYKDGKLKVIEFEDYNRGIDFIKFSPEQLLFAFSLSQNSHYLDHVQDKNDTRRIWQSLGPDLQQKLKKSYFPKVDFLSLEQG